MLYGFINAVKYYNKVKNHVPGGAGGGIIF